MTGATPAAAGYAVRLHPAERQILARANAGDADAAAYLERLRDRAEQTAALAALLERVKPATSTDCGTADEVDPGALAAAVEDAYLDGQARAATRGRAATRDRRRGREAMRRATEAAGILARAELVALDPRLGAAGSREVAGRMFRHRRETFRLAGKVLTVEGAREVPTGWSCSPPDLARRLRGCAAAWSAYHQLGVAGAAPIRCSAPLCPRCLGAAGGSRVRDWLPVVEALRRAGCIVVHLTATRPASLPGAPGATRHPVVLVAGERRRYAAGLEAHGGRVAARRGAAVPGEPLADALADLSHAWSSVTHGNKRTREWWRSTTAGALLGREWTGAGELRDGARWLRWHAHQHALVILRPDAPVSFRPVPYTRADGSTGTTEVACGPWWDAWVAAWCAACPGADPAGQRASLVSDSASALVEVLKYPFKPSALTSAQAAEVISATIGLHHHQTTGAWHGSSAVARAARGEDPGRPLDPGDRQVVDGLAAGWAAREAERAASAATLLYREPERGEPPRARRIEIPEYRDPWAPVAEPGRAVVPVTVAWLRWAVDTGRNVEAWEYRKETGWSGPRTYNPADLLESIEAG